MPEGAVDHKKMEPQMNADEPGFVRIYLRSSAFICGSLYLFFLSSSLHPSNGHTIGPRRRVGGNVRAGLPGVPETGCVSAR
jgi:hypothetical protein